MHEGADVIPLTGSVVAAAAGTIPVERRRDAQMRKASGFNIIISMISIVGK